MAEAEYHIQIRRGHSVRLRFWFDPISERILRGRDDLPIKDELSCDAHIAIRLLLPVISRFFKDKFYFHNELNLMYFNDVRKLIDELRNLSYCLELREFDKVSMGFLEDRLSIEMLVPEDVYEERYKNASPEEQREAVISHLPVLGEFYRNIADYLAAMIDKYEKKGFEWIAISTAGDK
ncbi:MAG: hypothetical protein K6E30_07695 [Lachnospiraceae bacterium]|nr:hypothetical protein [Lachnospiraceae bacterium]